MEVLEVGLRTQIAHIAGKRDPFVHLKRALLDGDACARRRTGPGGLPTAEDGYGEWMTRYSKLQTDARNEDFVRHHIVKYGEPLPLWVAVEFLDFGALARLFGLLDKRDQNAVARELGISGGVLLAGWLKSLNYVRNMAAHHNRLWNRTLTYRMRDFNPSQVGPDLHHVAASLPRDKIYVPLATLGYIARHVEPGTRWPTNLRDDLRKFPRVPYLSPEGDMGFPAGWQAEPLWANTR